MSINKVILLGNVGQDPEVRFSPNGTTFANITLATSEKWKDKQTGEQKEKTEWSKLVFSGRLAEVVEEYVTKGSKLYVEGKLDTRKWQNQQGQDQYTTEIRVFQMEMLDNKPKAQQKQGGFQQQAQQQSFNKPVQQPAGGFQQQNQQQAPKVNPQEPTIDFDDNIPF